MYAAVRVGMGCKMNKSEMRTIIDQRIITLVDKYYYDCEHGFSEFRDMYISAIIENLLLSFRFGLLSISDYLRLVDICVMIGSGCTMEERLKHEH